MKKVVAKRIRIARIERDMKQKDLADALGVSPQNVAKFESGEISMGIDTLARIADALNFPIAYFFESFPNSGARQHKKAA